MNTINRLSMPVLLLIACGSAGAGAPRQVEQVDVSVDQEYAAQWRRQRNQILEQNPGLDRDPTSLLIKFRDDADLAAHTIVRMSIGAKVVGTFPNVAPGLEHVSVSGSIDDAIITAGAIGRALGAIEYIEPDYIGHLNATPNDTFFNLEWGLNNTGQTVNRDRGTANADIDAPQAWDVSTGSATFVVADCDSGMLLNHEDLAGNLWSNPGETAGNGIDDDGNGYVDDVNGWDFYNNDNNPTDDNGHGTHTAGTIGAIGNNGKGVSGVMWSCRIAPLKIGSASGSISISAAISALNYCVGKGIKVSNHSWGGGAYSTPFFNALTSARAAGHIVVAAAGNGGADARGDNNDSLPSYPASYNLDNIIAVAAIDNDNKLARFSNYGATSVDLAAPGVTVASCYNSATNAYVYMDGTSMATPHVTGAVALVWSLNPGWTYSQVRTKILSSTKPLAALAGKCTSGGCLNLNNAVH